jgi:hypothetical protein
VENKSPKEFAVFILTNGRPDKVVTYNTLKKQGYTGPIYLVVDDLDQTAPQYVENYGEQVFIFDKQKIARTFDNGENSGDLRAAVFARNAIFELAREHGVKYFIQLDDDYTSFRFKFDENKEFISNGKVTDLDAVFSSMLKFFISSGATALSMAQEGDFCGGKNNHTYGQHIRMTRKCMNSWICAVDRPFIFTGRMNDDVNTYVRYGALGKLFFTTNQLSLQQPATQAVAGGMTDIYRAAGTYMKSFFTVMMQPSSVKIGTIQGRRIHHNVNWNRTVPRILRESVRK